MKKLLGILVLGLGLVFGVNANATEKPNAYFCTYKYAQKSLNPPANIYKFGTFAGDGCTLGKKISMKEPEIFVLKSNKDRPINKCPELLMGKNSEIPCRAPNKIELNRSINNYLIMISFFLPYLDLVYNYLIYCS